MLLSVDMADNVEVDNSDNDNNKIVKRLQLYKKLTIGATSYLTIDAKATFTELK